MNAKKDIAIYFFAGINGDVSNTETVTTISMALPACYVLIRLQWMTGGRWWKSATCYCFEYQNQGKILINYPDENPVALKWVRGPILFRPTVSSFGPMLSGLTLSGQMKIYVHLLRSPCIDQQGQTYIHTYISTDFFL